VAEDRKSDQCVFLAEPMALKYVLLELFVTTVTVFFLFFFSFLFFFFFFFLFFFFLFLI